jgi:serine/threonine protein phosphatase PrpC
MIPSDQPHLRVAAVSNPGRVRDHNEDSYGVTAYRLEPGDTPALLAVLADGIGGHQAGEVASALTVDAVVSTVESHPSGDPLEVLGRAVREAAGQVRQAATSDKAREGMGSTLAVAWIIGPKLYTVSVGDSRIYFRRDGDLHRISVDHTWIQEALDLGVIKPDEVEGHPNAHVLRRHIGGAKPPEPDFRLRLKLDESDATSVANQGLNLKPGDQLLLCSDGLTDLVSGPDIDAALAKKGPGATQDLLQMALDRGGHDNITIIVMEVPLPVGPSAASLPTRP